jgi:GT2 family glycosyltransferase
MPARDVHERPIHVVVVAFGAPDLLWRSLAGLGGLFPVTVVDNSSLDSVRSVTFAEGAHYVDSGRNRGFGAGVNVALRTLLVGEPVDVLLLNPDAMITPADLGKLSSFIHRSGAEDIGTASPRLRLGNGEEQRAMWPFPSPARAWIEAIGLGRLNRSRDFAVGTALLLRWEALRAVGLFDEGFFLYGEETDWQRRARSHGWRAALVEDAVATHVGAATSSDSARRECLFHAGTETYVRKWFGAVGWQAFRASVVVGCLARVTVLRGPDRLRAAERLGIHVRGPRRTAGLVAS